MAVVLPQVASEAGVTFPLEVSTTYEDPSGKFAGSISFSQALAKSANFSETIFSNEFMRRVMLDVFGHIAYAQLYNHPKYDAFQELVPDSWDNFYQYFGDPRYISLADQFFQSDSRFTVQFSVDYQDYARQVGSAPFVIKDIHLHFIQMSEFDSLMAAFDENRITYTKVFTDPWYERARAQRRGLVVVDNGTIYLFGYENGYIGAVEDMGFKPMEQLKNGSDIKRLKALEEQLVTAEHWFGLLFLSRSHPMVPSILTGIDMPLMCAKSLDNLDQARSWIEACNMIAEGMFK